VRRIGLRGAAATLVLALVACGGGGSSFKEPKGPAVATLEFSGKNWAFAPKDANAPAGILELKLTSTDGGHTLVIEGVSGYRLDAGGTGTSDAKKVELKKGTYTFYCDVAGHREAGMEGKLKVG